jgi:hypothetical protein
MKHGDEKGRRGENGRAAMVLCCRVARVRCAAVRGAGAVSFWGVGTSWQKVPWFSAFGGEKPGRMMEPWRGETRKAAAQSRGGRTWSRAFVCAGGGVRRGAVAN